MTALMVWEVRKLLAQWRVRIAFLLCLLGPMALAVVLSTQQGLPKDTLFGRHVHDSGFALPLLVLGFAGTWAFPLLTSVVAGDTFAQEDGLGTWGALLTRARSRSQVFWAKVLTAVASALLLLSVTAFSCLVAGVVATGTAPLLGLSGTEIEAGRATALVLLSWSTAAPPLLGFTALAVLLSVVSRSAVVGIGGPLVLGLVMQLAGLAGGLGRAGNVLLTTPFLAWRGLVRDDPYYGPLWQGAVVSVAWTAVCLLVANRVFVRRDVT